MCTLSMRRVRHVTSDAMRPSKKGLAADLKNEHLFQSWSTGAAASRDLAFSTSGLVPLSRAPLAVAQPVRIRQPPLALVRVTCGAEGMVSGRCPSLHHSTHCSLLSSPTSRTYSHATSNSCIVLVFHAAPARCSALEAQIFSMGGRELRKSSEILAEIMARYPARIETPRAPPSPPAQEEATMVPPSSARQLLVDEPRTTAADKVAVRARIARTAFVHARPPAVRRPRREKKPPAQQRRLTDLTRRCDAGTTTQLRMVQCRKTRLCRAARR